MRAAQIIGLIGVVLIFMGLVVYPLLPIGIIVLVVGIIKGQIQFAKVIDRINKGNL